MQEEPPDLSVIDRRVGHLFALVSEALAGATHALLSGEPETGARIAAADAEIDELTDQVNGLVWEEIERGRHGADELRQLVGILLILPELERSADLAEHIAQQAARSLGSLMTPVCRGCVQRMSEVALEMWQSAANAYRERPPGGISLHEADEEVDLLHGRLTHELGTGSMPPAVAGEVALLARFYERLGDHAVNLARRIAETSAS